MLEKQFSDHLSAKTNWKLWVSISFCLLFTQACFSQLSFGKSFDHLVDRAHLCFEEGRYQEAGILYDSAFTSKGNVFPLGSYHISATKAWAKARDADRAFFHLALATEKCWLTVENLSQSEVLTGIRSDARWEEIIQAIQAKEVRYREVVDALRVVRIQDQFLRQLEQCARNNQDMGPGEMALFYDNMNRYDSLNLLVLAEIVNQHGWLGANKIGDDANQTMWAVVQHCSEVEVQQRYLPLIKQSVLLGETPATQYAFLVDRIAVNRGAPQRYGTQICTDEDTGGNIPCPFDSLKEVEERRKEIGFEPLADYLRFFDIDLVKD